MAMEFDQAKFAEQLGKSLSQGLAPLLLQNRPKNDATKAAVVGLGAGWHNWPHGPGGYFGGYAVGLEPEVISAQLFWRGLADVLQLRGVRTEEVLLPFITGMDELSDDERETPCGDCISGETEACIQVFPLGLVCRETKEMKPSRIISRLNRGDIDMNLLNDVLGGQDASPWQDRTISSMDLNDILQVVTAWALLYELPPLFMQALGPMVWTGNPANNLDDGYKEFRGLNLLINTGHRHAIENVTCPALDSDVKNFAYADMATGTTGGYTWYQHMEMAAYYIEHNARRQKLDPAEWVIVMRPEQWQIASGLIPIQAIQAAVMNAAVATGFQVNMDGATLLRERDNMRNSMIMPLNGRPYRVITDDGIFEHTEDNNAHLDPGEYAADMYIVPVTYMGNRPAIWIDYKDFRFLAPEIAATDDLIGGFYRASADGRFSYTWVKNGPCFKIQAEIEPRIVLRTPQLAARIQNIKYVPMQHLRSPDFDSPYRFKGGVSVAGTTLTRYY